MKEQKDKKKKGNKGLMGSILNGTLLVREEFSKQFPFMVYITLLLMAIITNTYIAEAKNRELAEDAQKLNKLQVEYIQVRSDIMAASKQSVLAKKLEGCGIKEAIVPLKRINTNEQPENTEEQ
jgi:hypothetical protein